MLQQIIASVNQRYPNIHLTNQNINIGTATTVTKNILCREILHTSFQNANYKFAEKIIFSGRCTGRLAVAIGYNPAILNMSYIDKTNELIADYLHSLGYAGYYLLNLFPEVTPQKPNKSASYFNNFYIVLQTALARLPQVSSMDLFIFWGSSVYINIQERIAFDSILRLFASSYTMGTNNGINHKHPGRGVSSSTILHHAVNTPLILTNSKNGYLR